MMTRANTRAAASDGQNFVGMSVHDGKYYGAKTEAELHKIGCVDIQVGNIVDQTIEGYRVEGKRTVVRTTAAEGDTIFVHKAKIRGGGWLRFVKKVADTGYYVSWFKTKGNAVKGTNT